MKQETYTSTNSLRYFNAASEIQDYLGRWGFSTEEKIDGEMLRYEIENILRKHMETPYESTTTTISL